ncbi:40S ribosomal protein S29-like [Gracilinanus agilis]|uniref:40S ribosomal protein S29-like n=1 Tax=Gracilinanus agilis TaxID=191870 RepID=UPI001CFCBFD3|nr:40S ribosomal protein S29-like [Gracilinanus agilis]
MASPNFATRHPPTAKESSLLSLSSHQQLYWSHPRKFGQSCHVCSNKHGVILKYSLNMCHHCFQQYAKDIGFIKLD